MKYIFGFARISISAPNNPRIPEYSYPEISTPHGSAPRSWQSSKKTTNEICWETIRKLRKLLKFFPAECFAVCGSGVPKNADVNSSISFEFRFSRALLISSDTNNLISPKLNVGKNIRICLSLLILWDCAALKHPTHTRSSRFENFNHRQLFLEARAGETETERSAEADPKKEKTWN